MGQEIVCRARYQGRWRDGRALFETDEIVFRANPSAGRSAGGGATRVMVPLGTITDARAENGALHLAWTSADAGAAGGAGSLVLDLGAMAEKWLAKIRAPKSVIDKLGVKAGARVARVGTRGGPLDEVGQMLAARGIESKEGAPRAPVDVIFFAVDRRHDLERLTALRERLDPKGAIWVLRPKGVAAVTEADVMAAGKAHGLVDTKVVRFSQTHTAEKLVIPVASRPPPRV